MITRDSKPYIGVYTNSETSTSLLFKKSSFYYNIQFTYNNIVKSSAIIYVLNIGNYKTCFHQLAEKNTKAIVKVEEDKSKNKRKHKILRTAGIIAGSVAVAATIAGVAVVRNRRKNKK